jgi:ABC-2 type transport system permease protein
METVIPKTSAVLTALLRADFTTQWRNRRAVILSLLVPVIILATWKGFVKPMGGPFVLSNSIAIGLIATGLMGYSNSVARDRDKGIFQRLRVAPVTSWTIMASRLIVQLVMILMITTIVFVGGSEFDHVTLTPSGYILTYFAAIVGGAVYLSLGQMIVGLITNPETVSATTRLVYFVFIMSGMLGELYIASGDVPKEIGDAIQWSPYGTVKTILAVSMEPAKWNNEATMAVLVTVLYTVVFTAIGINKFKWTSK